jgi:DNA-binding MarR family transcriptional regulator
VKVSIPDVPDRLPADSLHEAANRVHSVALRLLRIIRTVDVETGLSGPRASLLSVLVFAGPLSISRLAEIEQVSVPAITKLVDALVKERLAKRRRSNKDRRVVMVQATDHGKRLLEEGRARRVEAMAGTLAKLTARELEQVDRAFTILQRKVLSRG